MISIRRLAAVDLIGLGSRLVIIEFAIGVVGPLGLGAWTVLRSTSLGAELFGAYLVSLSINYVPLLLHAIDITRYKSALAEIADEAPDRGQLFRKYRRVSLLLLLPAVVPSVAFVEYWHGRNSRRGRTPT